MSDCQINKKGLWCFFLCFLFGNFSVASAFSLNDSIGNKASVRSSNTCRLLFHVVDENNEPVILARCELKQLGLYAATDINGDAVMSDVPCGEYDITVSYVGYQAIKRKVNVVKDLRQDFKMVVSSLALKEVEVVAKQNVAGESTSSLITRQAIDHLQAFSLDDIMQLVPGNLIKNTSLTDESYLTLRTLKGGQNATFGSSIMIDGVQISNNGTMAHGAFESTVNVGTQLRTISADDIESVEVIRGIASAEYGDFTSGMTVINSRVGVTPWMAKVKVNPAMRNYSLSKGLKFVMPNSSKVGTVNFSFDYANAWSDPRMKSESFDRYTGSVNVAYDFSKKWHTTTKVRYNFSREWNGNDPDAVSQSNVADYKNSSLSLSHNGKLSLNKAFARTVSYTLSLSLNEQTTRRENCGVANPNGLLPILTATESGYYFVPWVNTSYFASGGTESKPGNVTAKLTDQFYVRAGDTNQNFKLGVEYHYDWNSGRGYYNDNDSLPLNPKSNGRVRSFSDVPGLHQFNAFAEDKLTWMFADDRQVVVQAGVRFTAVQPFMSESVLSLSPRINSSFDVTRWLDIRLGYGLTSKTPSLAYLYPDKNYTDVVAANYMPQDNPSGQLLLYRTEVYQVERTLGLQNATNRKFEVGLDLKLPNKRKISIIGYHEKTGNGFSSAQEYYTFTSDYFSINKGLSTQNGMTIVDWNNPERTDTLFSTTGKLANNSVTVNKGVELDFDLGEIEVLKTHVYLNGAYTESKSYTKGITVSNPHSLPTEYKQYGTTPFKIVYRADTDYDIYRQFNTSLRLVTHIPVLKMVASLTGQAIWYNYSRSYAPGRNPIGWIDTDLTYHEITDDMLADENYTIKGISLHDQIEEDTKSTPTKNPITWMVSGRLTKELGTFGSLSMYVNNMFFYEPYLSSSSSSTLTQRNTGSFSFGFELSFKL